MQITQQKFWGALRRPLHSVGLTAARRWPWPVSVEIKNGRRLYVDLRSGIGRGLFVKGEFDPAVFEPLYTALKSGGTFVDIGANVGFYSMLALEVVGEAGVIHAFEIDHRPLRCLHKTLSRYRIENLFVHEFAVGRYNGTVGFCPAAESGNSCITENGGQRQVRMMTLDNWWRQSKVTNIQAVKIDIEGAELLALEGGKDMLCKMRPSIVCEADEKLESRFGYKRVDLVRFLAGLRYSICELKSAWSPTIVATPK